MNDAAENTYRVDHPHALPVEDVLKQLTTRSEGLGAEEAEKRLIAAGPNRLPEAEKEGILKRVFKHFHDLLIYILIAAAAVTAALGHWIDTGVILAVVVINAVIGFIQEGKAERALEGLRKMLSLHAHVRRDEQWIEIEADELVPGDSVRLRSGDRVPADLRLAETTNLRIEESALTGESVPAEKKTEPAPADVGIAMGIKGTEATKEAADIVLADDNFTSIERAIEEGRTIYDNLRKAILFILPVQQPLPARIEPVYSTAARQPHGLGGDRRTDGSAADVRLCSVHAAVVRFGFPGTAPLADIFRHRSRCVPVDRSGKGCRPPALSSGGYSRDGRTKRKADIDIGCKEEK